MELKEVEEKRERGEFGWEKVEIIEKIRQREERWSRIKGSEYNEWYK